MAANKTIMIEDEQLAVDWQDEGPWRSFHLSTEGDCLMLLLEHATVTAIDQDGGEMYTEDLYDCPQDVIDASEKLIAQVFMKATKKEAA